MTAHTFRSPPESAGMCSAGLAGDSADSEQPGAASAAEQGAAEQRAAEQRAAEQRELAYRAVLNSAVRSLSQREHGRRELARKLKGKRHDPELIERVLDYLLEHDLQSDERFAESLIRSRVQRGYGPMKIRQELAAKGVRESEIERHLTEPSEFWESVAAQSLSKKFAGTPGSREEWAVQARFLTRRGFPADVIYHVLGEQTD